MNEWDDDADIDLKVQLLSWACGIFLLIWLFWPWIKWLTDHTGLS